MVFACGLWGRRVVLLGICAVKKEIEMGKVEVGGKVTGFVMSCVQRGWGLTARREAGKVSAVEQVKEIGR